MFKAIYSIVLFRSYDSSNNIGIDTLNLILYKNGGPEIYNTECVRIKDLNTTALASNVYSYCAVPLWVM